MSKNHRTPYNKYSASTNLKPDHDGGAYVESNTTTASTGSKPTYIYENKVSSVPEEVQHGQFNIVEPEEKLVFRPGNAIDIPEEPSKPMDVGPDIRSGRVIAKRLNCRKYPNKNSEVLDILHEGKLVQVLMEESTVEWYKVEYESYHIGYCMKEFIEIK